MNVKITSIICSICLSSGDKYILDCEENSSILQENENPLDISKNICSNNLLLSGNWIEPVISSAYNIDNVLNVIYVCVIPLDITLKDNTKWIALNNEKVDGIDYMFEFNKTLSMFGA